MERSLFPKVQWGKTFRNWARPSLKWKVRQAFVLVLLVVLPLLILSISYSTRLLEQASKLDLENARFEAIDDLRSTLDRNIETGLPVLDGMQPAVALLTDLGLDLFDTLVILETAELARQEETLCLQQESEGGALLALFWAQVNPCTKVPWRQDTRLALASLRVECSRRLALARGEMAGLADDATRNLVTLLILTSLIVVYLTTRFPERLLQPLSRIAHAVRMAEGGRLDVRAPLTNLQELDELAISFNNTMASIDEFDTKKRNRILLDRNKLDFLVTQLPDPAAIMDITSSLDVCNLGFREVFAFGNDWRGKRLSELLSEGSSALRLALNNLAATQEPLVSPFSLERSGIVFHGHAEIVPILGAGAEVAGAVLVLRGLRQAES